MRSQGWRSPPPPPSPPLPPLPLPLAQLIFKCWGLAVSLASGWVWWEARGAHLQKGKRNFAAYFSAPKQQFMKKLSRCQNWQLISTFSNTHTQKKKVPLWCNRSRCLSKPARNGTLTEHNPMHVNERAPHITATRLCAAFLLKTDAEVFTFTSTELCN